MGLGLQTEINFWFIKFNYALEMNGGTKADSLKKGEKKFLQF
jgi:hypothetical protein